MKVLMFRTLILPTVSPMDYSSFSMTLTFDTCETHGCVNVSIVDDLVDEPDEVFVYSLGPPPAGLDPRITIRPDMGEVFIFDNDGNNNNNNNTQKAALAKLPLTTHPHE